MKHYYLFTVSCSYLLFVMSRPCILSYLRVYCFLFLFIIRPVPALVSCPIYKSTVSCSYLLFVLSRPCILSYLQVYCFLFLFIIRHVLAFCSIYKSTVSCSYLLFVLSLSLYLVLFTSLLFLDLNIVFTVPSPLLIYRPLSFVLVLRSHLFTNLPSLVHTTNIFITCSLFSLSLIFFIHLLHPCPYY